MAPLSSFFARGTSAFGGLTGGGGSSNSNAGAGGSGHTRSWSQPLASSTGLSSPQPPPSGTAEPPATTEEATTTTSTTTQQSSSGPVNHVESTSDVAGSTSSPGSAFPALRTATAGSSSPLAGTAASAVGHVRSHSHTISNPGSAAATSTAVPSSMRSPFDSHNGAPSSLHGLGFGDDVPLGMADSASVRRYHTLSTGSGSRLARLEKKHALANMDEHDRRLYGDETPEEPSVPELPPVPVAAQPSSGFQVVRAYKGVPGEASKGGMSGDNEALYAQATVQRNTSHPTRLQSPSQQPSRTWGPSTGRMGASIVKSDSLRRRMAGMSEGAADRSGNWRARSTLQEEGEDENASRDASSDATLASDLYISSTTANLHRAASDRIPGAVGHHRSLSNVDSADPVRRHQSLRADGRWGSSPKLPSDFPPGIPHHDGVVGSGARSPPMASDGSLLRTSSLKNPGRALSPPAAPSRTGAVSPLKSPVGVVGIPGAGPWSPTAEEVAKLREPMKRQNSGENLGSPPQGHVGNGVSISPRRQASNEGGEEAQEDDGPDFVRMQSAFQRMEMANGTSPLSVATNLPAGQAGALQGLGSGTTPTTATRARVTLPPLVTNFGAGKPGFFNAAPGSQAGFQGPASAAAYVPPIGHSFRDHDTFSKPEALARAGQTAGPGIGSNVWGAQKQMLAGSTQAGPVDWNLNQQGAPSAGPQASAAGSMPALEQQLHQQMLINQQLQQLQHLQQQQQILQQQQAQLLSQTGMSLPAQPQGAVPSFQQPPGLAGVPQPPPQPPLGMPSSQASAQPYFNSGAANGGQLGAPFGRPFVPNGGAPPNGFPQGFYQMPGYATGSGAPAPHGLHTGQAPDVQTLAQKKGYNPTNFDLQPKSARFFVIKSYTEEDVHKSLKYEIWASTDLGNKRLDKAFKESGSTAPIYLFFSVNASGHFCGMAQMLTGVDYHTNSTVWATDKWKGIFKVKWIFVKDIPNSSLRHIRLNNTPENKPVTSSRDTQEVPYPEGLSILHILSSFPSRTTLLQDFDYYDQTEQRKGDGTPQGGQTVELAPTSNGGFKAPSPNPNGVHPPNLNGTSFAPVHGVPPPPQQPIRRFAQHA